MEGVTIGVTVAGILLCKDGLENHWDRQAEIGHIREVILSARLAIAKAQAGTVAVPIQIQGRTFFREQHRSREEAQEEQWRRLTAKLSDVLEFRTSRLTYDEKRELRKHFPGTAVDGRRLLGDGLDVILRNEISMHYKDMFSGAESIEWLGLPPASEDVVDGLIPPGR